MSGSMPEETSERTARRAAMNQEILETLQAKLAENPSLNLDHEMPRLQFACKKKYFPHPTALLLQQRRKPPPPKPQEFPAGFLRSTAQPVVLSPLSDAAKTLIFGPGGSEDDDNLNDGVRRALEHSEVLAVLRGRGGVLRCGDIAIKIVPASDMGAEYSALQYLAEHAADFPAPKPHGLIGFGSSRLLLTSYVPSTTLQSVWPGLGHENKLSIQRQLDQILTRLRDIRQQPGGRLAGVGGEGVSDSHAWVDHVDKATAMTTAAEFRDFQFSIKAPCGPEYTAFLNSLLPCPDPGEPAGFTHGDIHPGNITVDIDSANPGEYVVTGIVDWEESGFYPAWFESSKVLYTFTEDGGGEMQDWWRYVPGCVAPARYPVEWAVGRLRDKANGVDV
ncbi:kinase-like domain-containing protein [Parachaetomium inaequale]|uniref:Kinase-like domain-containing protein n=1 Tax=Parachaetomium inaequale TaxID=2588326 RepID=A0AAN6PM08_9PEZI|nr:kinase-like domain-containing protein [Parachaetomium inaequale]